jgi:alpha-tubulin suppressor-like RCC1 family protein
MLKPLAAIAVMFSVVVSSGTADATSSSAATSGASRTQTTRLVVGDEHSCVLLHDGVVKCWGDNTFGQLGVPMIAASSSPITVSSFGEGRHAIELAAGKFHTCALLNDGSISCWGHNSLGSLGNGSSGHSDVPQNINSHEFVSVRSGGFTTCGATNASKLFCWGRNARFQTGKDVGMNVVSSPEEIVINANIEALKSLKMGDSHSCFVNDSNEIWCWGANDDGQLGTGETSLRSLPIESFRISSPNVAVGLGVGGKHSCVITSSNQIVCWGFNEFGQLGDATESEDLSPRDVINHLGGDIDLGFDHSCSVNEQSIIFCWGNNDEGQIGDGTTTARNVPTQVQLPSGATAQQIAAGLSHTCALLHSDDVMCWGNNSGGKLGDGTTSHRSVPTKVVGLRTAPAASSVLTSEISHNSVRFMSSFLTTDVTSHRTLEYGIDEFLDGDTETIDLGWFGKVQQVSAGQHHSCVVISGGHVKCWGDNSEGALGTGEVLSRTDPTDVVALNGRASSVAVGRSHSCAVLVDGGLQCWGDNSAGQLGDSTVLSRMTPVTPNVTGVQHVVLGDDFTCALQVRGVVSCWGSNALNQLGFDGSSSSEPKLVTVDNAHTVMSLSASASRVCAVLSNSGVKCWGDGSLIESPGTFAAPVGNVAVGKSHACAVLRTAALQCWGDDSVSQLGDGESDSTGNIVSPVFGSGDKIVAVHAADNSSCALLSTGVVKCWGDSSTGLTAQQSDNPVHTPTVVSSLNGASTSQLSLAQQHGCALTEQGNLWCWGNASRLQQGIVGATSMSSTPMLLQSLTDATVVTDIANLDEDTAYFYQIITHSVVETHHSEIGTFNTLELPSQVPVEETPLVDQPQLNEPVITPPVQQPDVKSPQLSPPAVNDSGKAISPSANSVVQTPTMSSRPKKKPSVKVGSLTAVSRVLRSLDYAVPRPTSGRKMWMTVLDKRICRVYNSRLWAIRKGSCQLMVLTMSPNRRLTMSRTQIRVVR